MPRVSRGITTSRDSRGLLLSIDRVKGRRTAGFRSEKRATTLTNWRGTPGEDPPLGRIDGPRSLRVINYRPATATPPRRSRGVRRTAERETHAAWARCERSIHYNAIGGLLSSTGPPCRTLSRLPVAVIVARARPRIWDTAFHYRARNKSPPSARDARHRSDLDLVAMLRDCATAWLVLVFV